MCYTLFNGVLSSFTPFQVMENCMKKIVFLVLTAFLFQSCLTIRDLNTLTRQETGKIGTIETQKSFFNPFWVENKNKEKAAVLKQVENEARNQFGNNIVLHRLESDGYPTFLSFLTFGMYWKTTTKATVLKSDKELDLKDLEEYDFVDEEKYDDEEKYRKEMIMMEALKENARKDQIEKEKEYKEKGFTDREINSIKNSQIFIGMSKDALLESWGSPDKINRTLTQYSDSQQWIYYRGYQRTQYVYLKNNVITTIKDR